MLGVSEERFWDSAPVDLDPYRKMDEFNQERLDYNMWMMGMYITNAVGVAVSNALNGKKSRAKYLERPLLQEAKQNETPEDPKADFHRFEAWATVFNEHFVSKQG